ncbi:MAG: hypothetical protein JXB85_03800 [Anaerolineales bacterium]|nr:hypothetical protein [Anaerolineales bacterium]
MMPRLSAILLVLILTTLACAEGTPPPYATPEHSIFDTGRTAYGFFPSPPEASLQSVFDTYAAMGEHADVVLLQQNIPWEQFVDGAEIESERITDIANQYLLAGQNGLELVFVVDPLNGLNRMEFYNLPSGWEASFANPDVRAAFTNFTLRIVRSFHPRYLGLASEINTYMDTHPDDYSHFISLYNEVYALVKAEAPETQIFVTFQWEEMNNLFPQVAQGERFEVNWHQMEAFEPRLDVWAISSYPFVAFASSADIPADYYTRLVWQTDRPLAVAEGGYTTRPVGFGPGSPDDQVAYLEAVHAQIGERLDFWIYLLLSDFNLDSYAPILEQEGHGQDLYTLGMFAHVGLRLFDGTPKPALAVWDSFRAAQSATP